MGFSIFQNNYLKIKWSYKKLYFMIRFNEKKYFSPYLAYINVVFALKPNISAGHYFMIMPMGFISWARVSKTKMTLGRFPSQLSDTIHIKTSVSILCCYNALSSI